jgi:hypothetical protein
MVVLADGDLLLPGSSPSRSPVWPISTLIRGSPEEVMSW